MFFTNKKAMVTGLVLVIILGLFLIGCGQKAEETSGDQAAGEPYEIGVILDTSGSASSLGEPERNTALMIAEEINKNGGIDGHPVKLNIVDSKSVEQEAVLAVKKLLQNDKIIALIGSTTTGTTMAMIDQIQKDKRPVPLISPASSAAIVEPVSERRWIFKVPQSDTHIAAKMIDYLKAKNIKKVAFLSVSNAFGDNGKKAFEAAAKGTSIEVLRYETFGQQDTDMTAQLTRVKGQKPEAVIVWATPPSASIVTKNFRTLGLNMPLIHSHGVANKAFIETAGDAANGVIFPVGKILVAEDLPSSDPQKKPLLDYIKKYEGKYGGMTRTTFGAHIWDALYMIKAAVENGKSANPAKIREELEKLKGFVGLDGIFNLSPQDHNGLNKDALVLVEIRDGKWKLVKDVK